MSEKKPPEHRISAIPPFGLRMLPDLRAKVEEAAAENGRSMNAEIVSRLQQTFDAPVGQAKSDLLTPEGLEAMRAIAADTKQTLLQFLAGLDRAEALAFSDEARERTTLKPE